MDKYCMTYNNAFLNNLTNSYEAYYGPKGNLATWEHASKLFLHDNYRLAPKVPFLFHVNFVLNSDAKALLPSLLYQGQSALEIGLLVKTIQLPKYTPRVEIINRYNQKKNVETQIAYDPVTIEFHDDNDGLNYALLSAYYKYYFVDGNYQIRKEAYTPNLTYSGPLYRYGLDNETPHKHFFKEIHVSQLTRGVYHRYTLVNPLLSKFDHDNLDYATGNRGTQNTITINYEAVFYETGEIDAETDNPDGFTQIHYDETPSALGGLPKRNQALPLANALTPPPGNPPTFKPLLQEKEFQTQEYRSVQGYSFENFRRNRFKTFSRIRNQNLVKNDLKIYDFLKIDGERFDVVEFAKTIQKGTVTVQELRNDPSVLDSARRNLWRRLYQASGKPGGIEAADREYNLRVSDPKFLEELDKLLGL